MGGRCASVVRALGERCAQRTDSLNLVLASTRFSADPPEALCATTLAARAPQHSPPTTLAQQPQFATEQLHDNLQFFQVQ
jgi:hypothetical protein